MATSGRDRDPAFRKRKVAARKPAPSEKISPSIKQNEAEKQSQESPKPVDQKKEITQKTSSETIESKTYEKKPVNEPSTSKAKPESNISAPISKTNPKTTTSVEKKEKSEELSKVQAALTPNLSAKTEGQKEKAPKEKPASPPSDSSGKTTKKRKLMGVLVAIVFILAIIVVGYFVMESISKNEKQSHENTEFGTETNENNKEESESNEDQESTVGEISEGETEEATESTSTSSASESTEENEESKLSEDNSFEKEVEEVSASQPDASDEAVEKEALKSKIIRKKGDFEIPCWIIAFSANSKKPLANTNYSTLEALGYDAGIYWIPKYFPSDKELYKVYVGPYKSPEEAQSMLPAIRNLQSDAYIMKIEE